MKKNTYIRSLTAALLSAVLLLSGCTSAKTADSSAAGAAGAAGTDTTTSATTRSN